MPIQEEEHKCEEFDQMWIFTYGDMVTLLLVFFVFGPGPCRSGLRT